MRIEHYLHRCRWEVPTPERHQHGNPGGGGGRGADDPEGPDPDSRPGQGAPDEDRMEKLCGPRQRCGPGG